MNVVGSKEFSISFRDAILATIRKRDEIETLIEILVSLLDFVDGCPDLEDAGDDEPHLGWTEMEARWQCFLSGDDREEENEHGGDITDEPHDGINEDMEPEDWN